jgi:hypothetical protein
MVHPLFSQFDKQNTCANKTLTAITKQTESQRLIDTKLLNHASHVIVVTLHKITMKGDVPASKQFRPFPSLNELPYYIIAPAT